jgi:hypothetical protein
VAQVHLLGVAHVAVDVEVDDGLLLHFGPHPVGVSVQGSARSPETYEMTELADHRPADHRPY